MTGFIVLGGFGLAAQGVFGISRIERVAVDRAEQLVGERLGLLASETTPVLRDQPPQPPAPAGAEQEVKESA